MTKRERQQLEELVSSDGWALFTRLVREDTNPTTAMQVLSLELSKVESMETFGAIAAAAVIGQTVVERMLQLPYSYLEMGELVDESQVDG